MDIVNVVGTVIQHQENLKADPTVSFGGSLSTGIYIIHFNQGLKQFSTKVIKQ